MKSTVYQYVRCHEALLEASLPIWQACDEEWSGEWWQGESSLDLYETLEDLRDNIPPDLHARVAAIIASGSDIEDLDI
jgi:EXLDI family protein